MRRALILLALVLGAGCVKTTHLRGRIVDCQTQSPVEGADVQLSAPASGVSWEPEQTASDGAFTFDVKDAAKAGALHLTAVKKGYQSAQKTYSSPPGSAQDVCLAPTLR